MGPNRMNPTGKIFIPATRVRIPLGVQDLGEPAGLISQRYRPAGVFSYLLNAWDFGKVSCLPRRGRQSRQDDKTHEYA